MTRSGRPEGGAVREMVDVGLPDLEPLFRRREHETRDDPAGLDAGLDVTHAVDGERVMLERNGDLALELRRGDARPLDDDRHLESWR